MSMSVTGSSYNFTNVTNAQFLQQIQSLRQQGALSSDQSVLAMIDASGGDSVPVSGQPLSASQALSDSTQRDFLSVFQTQSDWMHSTPGSVGASQIDSLLQTLKAYQGQPTADASSGVSIDA